VKAVLLAIFALTYVGISARRVRVLPIGRPAMAMVGASAMVLAGAFAGPIGLCADEALRRAKANPRLAAAFAALKTRGVKFRICANTLEAYHLGLETLWGASEGDLVQAAVAELIHLQKQGFGYIKF